MIACLVLLLVTGLTRLPFTWAKTSSTYLSYCFQPGAAAETRLAAWMDWQPNIGPIAVAWQRLTGREATVDDGLAYPCSGQVISGFQYRYHPVTGQMGMHYGIDIAGTEGAAVYAAGKGKVLEIANDQSLGLYVLLEHDNEVRTKYAHLQEANVQLGEQVQKGQVIGKMGRTGITNSTHLHFEVWVNNQPVDPKTVLERTGP